MVTQGDPAPRPEETRKMFGTRVSAGTMTMRRNASARKIKRKRNVTEAATKRSEKNPIRRKRSMASVMMPSRTANRFGGALYVLKKDSLIRISVGGLENEETKINKSKALAQKALQRL